MNAGFLQSLYNWYQENKRVHPWLGSKDPYLIWLSEVIMQQTRIEHGTAYFRKFSKKYPTVFDLSGAEEDEVLKLWEGLGYYSRARNLLFTAKEIVSKYNGRFPDQFKEIKQLKGIGDYTASAILSFAYNQTYAVLDGNVMRILSRVFGIRTAIDTSEGRNELHDLAQKLIDRKNPAKYNQAIMDFGALVCTPLAPKCDECPLQKNCYALKHGLVDLLPVRSKKVRRRNRYFNYLIFTDGKHTLIERRTGRDIWQNLYEFPLIESNKKMGARQLANSQNFRHLVATGTPIKILSRHQRSQELTHQSIRVNFFMIQIDNLNSVKISNGIKVTKSGLKKFAFPGAIRNYLQEITTFRS